MKTTTHAVSISIMAILLIPIVSQIPYAFALNSLPTGITMFTEQKKYTAGESVRLIGQIHDSVYGNSLILFTVIAPDQQKVLTSKQTIGSDILEFSFPLDKKETRTGEWKINIRYSDMDEDATFMLVEKGLFDTAVLNKPVLRNSQGTELAPESQRVGEKMVISADLENDEHEQQAYAFVVQVIDATGATVMVSFTTGTLPSGDTVSPAVQWQPSTAGTYVVQVMAWNGLANPVPLDEKRSSTFEILA